MRSFKELVGFTITGVVSDKKLFGTEVLGLTLENAKFKKRKVAFVLKDAEGNGAGHLEILDAN
jgi:uncharacterized protein (UPF0303 family)